MPSAECQEIGNCLLLKKGKKLKAKRIKKNSNPLIT